MSDARSKHKIIILGGGTAGWMAANLFVAKLPSERVEICLVESPDVDIIGVGEGSTPTLKRFFEMIGVTEKEWMPRCNATYKLNIRFSGWSPASGNASYSHPFFSQLDTFSQRAFVVNCMTRRLKLDVNTNPQDFFINAVLAKQGAGPLTPENFPFRMEYGYHFDSSLMGKMLAEFAFKRGVNYKLAHVDSVLRHENGDIRALCLRNGEILDAEFFVDCTGFASLLMQKTLDIQFCDFGNNLFNDSAVVMPTPIGGEIPVETTAEALTAGWCWKIPLQNRFGNGYVYSSSFISHDSAEHEFRRHLGMLEADVECRRLKMRVGQLEHHWSHNCLAVGLSQGFIEPLEATALHLVQISLELFIAKYLEGDLSSRYRDEFNKKIKDRFERVRDYIVAHYKLNTRDDSAYWQENRNNKQLSDSLIQLLDVWFRAGDLSKEIERQNIESHFGTLSWHCLLAGYGVFPDVAADQPGEGDRYKELQIEKFLGGCALNFSSHNKNLSMLDSKC